MATRESRGVAGAERPAPGAVGHCLFDDFRILPTRPHKPSPGRGAGMPQAGLGLLDDDVAPVMECLDHIDFLTGTVVASGSASPEIIQEGRR